MVSPNPGPPPARCSLFFWFCFGFCLSPFFSLGLFSCQGGLTCAFCSLLCGGDSRPPPATAATAAAAAAACCVSCCCWLVNGKKGAHQMCARAMDTAHQQQRAFLLLLSAGKLLSSYSVSLSVPFFFHTSRTTHAESARRRALACLPALSRLRFLSHPPFRLLRAFSCVGASHRRNIIILINKPHCLSLPDSNHSNH